MRKIIMLLTVGILAAGLAPAAFAGPPAEGCATPTVLTGSDGTGDYAGVCTPLGSLVVGGSTSNGAYIYGDGANQNPPPLAGYLVVGVTAGGSVFARCSGDPGQWDGSYTGLCPG